MNSAAHRAAQTTVAQAMAAVRLLTSDEHDISRADLLLARCWERHPAWASALSAMELAAVALQGVTQAHDH